MPHARCFDDGLKTDRILDEFAEDVWTSKLLNEAESKAAAGRLLEAVDLVELVLTMEPTNDIARARLHGLTQRLVARPRRGDETVRLGC
jgi:hypothetical protein